MKPENDQEENELVILHLRQLCEAKQKTHVHIGEAPSVKLIFVLLLLFLPPYSNVTLNTSRAAAIVHQGVAEAGYCN